MLFWKIFIQGDKFGRLQVKFREDEGDRSHAPPFFLGFFNWIYCEWLTTWLIGIN